MKTCGTEVSLAVRKDTHYPNFPQDKMCFIFWALINIRIFPVKFHCRDVASCLWHEFLFFSNVVILYFIIKH